MKQLLLALAILLLAALPAQAEDITVKAYSNAPVVKEIYVKKFGDKVTYREDKGFLTDSQNNLQNETLRHDFHGLQKNLIVYYIDFNPLDNSVALDSKNEKSDLSDPTPFFKALASYQPIFAPAVAAAPPAGMRGEGQATLRGDVEVPSQSGCDTLEKNLAELLNSCNNMPEDKSPDDDSYKKEAEAELKKLAVDKEKLKEWKALINKEDGGIESTIGSIITFDQKLKDNITRIKKAIDTIKGDKYKGMSCSEADVAKASYVVPQANEAIRMREASSKGLQDMVAYLKKFPAANWQDKKTYKVGAIEPPAQQNFKKATLTVKPVSYTASTDGVVVVKSLDDDKENTSVTSTFSVYEDRWVVYKASAGFVFSPLKSRKFSTNTVNGNQVVVKTEDSDNYHAAAFLDVYFTRLVKWWDAFPFFQAGIATAKEYPALLVGGGWKFSDSFSFSVGGAFGFTKKLHKLSEGATVTGQAEIDKDEQVDVYPSWYLSVQYNF